MLSVVGVHLAALSELCVLQTGCEAHMRIGGDLAASVNPLAAHATARFAHRLPLVGLHREEIMKVLFKAICEPLSQFHISKIVLATNFQQRRSRFFRLLG